MYTTSGSTPTEPSPVPVPTAYSSRGCYTETTDGRALAGKTSPDDEMDVEKCAAICADAGFSMFGLEYYREVFQRYDSERGKPRLMHGSATVATA